MLKRCLQYVEASSKLSDLVAAIEMATAEFEFDYFSYRFLLRNLLVEKFGDGMIAHSLPQRRMDAYYGLEAWKFDPFIRQAQRKCVPFRRSFAEVVEAAGLDESRYGEFAREIRRTSGLAIPLRSGIGDMAVMTFFKDDGEIDLNETDIAELFLCATTAHQKYIDLQAEMKFTVGKLSTREAEALSLAAQGMTVKEVARLMAVAPTTADTLLKRCQDKLGTTNRVASVVRALASGQVVSTRYIQPSTE